MSPAPASSMLTTTSSRSAGLRVTYGLMPRLCQAGAVSEDTTAGRVLDLLADAGVTTVFGLPGVHNLAFWEALASGRPRIVGVRHEQTSVYAADGLSRATGQLGVALTTSGPGAANAVAAFGEAAASQSAVVLLASDVPAALRRPGRPRGLL